MMRYLIYTLLIGFILSCSDNSSSFESGEFIETTVSDSTLTVTNTLVKPIYYFAVEANSSISILWAAISTDENKIRAFETIEISLNDIGVDQKGQEIIFYYWMVKEPELEDIKNIVIKTD